MKGTSFQKPFEFRLEVDGESWNQGDQVTGTLIVKNHGTGPLPLQGLRVELAEGELKKVRAKSAEAFESIAKAEFNAPELGGGQEARFPWSFTTDRNCAITDTGGSLFLLYGNADSPEKLGQLQLAFKPYEIIQQVLDVFLAAFRFVVKTQKFSKGWVDVKLAPPDSKAFSTLEYLVASFRFEGDVMELHYKFQIKKVEATVANVDVKKDKLEFEQEYRLDQCRIASGRFNHEGVEAGIREALSKVESKVVF